MRPLPLVGLYRNPTISTLIRRGTGACGGGWWPAVGGGELWWRRHARAREVGPYYCVCGPHFIIGDLNLCRMFLVEWARPPKLNQSHNTRTYVSGRSCSSHFVCVCYLTPDSQNCETEEKVSSWWSLYVSLNAYNWYQKMNFHLENQFLLTPIQDHGKGDERNLSIWGERKKKKKKKKRNVTRENGGEFSLFPHVQVIKWWSLFNFPRRRKPSLFHNSIIITLLIPLWNV